MGNLSARHLSFKYANFPQYAMADGSWHPQRLQAYLGGERTMEFNERVYRSRSRPWYLAIGPPKFGGSWIPRNWLQLTFTEDCICSSYKIASAAWIGFMITDHPWPHFSIMDYANITKQLLSDGELPFISFPKYFSSYVSIQKPLTMKILLS